VHDDDIQQIARKLARSGKVEHSDPVVLHDTRQSRITMLAWFIRRSAGTELHVRLELFKKHPGVGLVQEGQITLRHQATVDLARSIQAHLAVANEELTGEYFAVRLRGGTTALGDHDPREVAQALSAILGTPEVARRLSELALPGELITALRSALRIAEMRKAVQDLRSLLDSGEHHEEKYQRWCTLHSWAFGNGYIAADEVRAISTGDNVDLLLPSVISGLRDVVELKRPDMELVLWDKQHRNYYFSSEASKAIGQCHRYLDILQDVAAHGLLDHPQVVAYHPRAVVVIGRSNDWSSGRVKGLHGLNSRLRDISVMTYDHLLAQSERLLDILSAESDDDDQWASDFDPDELPF
jgi:hypothetical protein